MSRLLHCPSCGALQPQRARCGVCGAAFGDPDAPPGSVRHLAGVLLMMIGGLVALGVLLIGLIYLIL